MFNLLQVAAPVLLCWAAFQSIKEAYRTRELRRLDVALFLAAWVGVIVAPQGAAGALELRSTLIALRPYLALRLVRHFRSVSPPAFVISVVIPIGLAVWYVVTGQDSLPVRAGFVGVGLGGASLAFLSEARRSAGVKARRLAFAAVGGAAFVLPSAVLVFSPVLSDATKFEISPWLRLLENAGAICFFFAFTPPKRLITRWRRSEQADYVGRSTEREPEERGWLASRDLVAGATRTVGGAVAFVARRHDDTGDLAVVASSDEKLSGWRFSLGGQMVGQSVSLGTPMLGRTNACETPISNRLAAHGELVLVAPIAASGSGAGVVIAVHRRGALFPEDDLSSLAQMARSAAVAIDHAALVRERRAAAQEVANRRLRELENRVGVMVDSIRDYAMLVVDGSGTVAAWHLGAAQLFGYSREEVARRSVASLFGLTASDIVKWLAEAAVSGVAEWEGDCHRADGTRFIGVTSIRPLMPEAGMPPGFVIVTHDVSEQRRLEERVRQGQKMEAIGTLASGVAHDFNNILAAIIGHADWLEGGMSGDARIEQVTEIQRAAERGVDMTQQLLAFGRRETLKPVAIDLGLHVRDMLPMLRRLIEPHIEIVDATGEDLPPVRGTRASVHQVVLNLAVNARDAMPDGGRLAFRTVETSFEGDSKAAGSHVSHVLLEVSDTGFGMDAETRRRIFEPFFTTKEVGEGTGLGLATVYGIVQDMRGLIEVDSEPGRGTTFRVYFPSAPELDRPALVEPPAVAGGETILLIEDDASLRGYLRHVLEEGGYRVLEASGPLDALTVVERHPDPIRLVVSDVAMPGMSGPVLVAELTKRHPDLTAVFISGHGEGEALRFGVPPSSRWLQKPFSPTDLLDQIARVLSPP